MYTQLGILYLRLTSLILEGTVELQGREQFSVFPAYFLANTDQEDGVMISFMAEEEGDYGSILQIVSNDPAQPIVEFAVKVTVVPPTIEEDSGLSGDTLEGQPVGGCGCSTQKNVPLEWLALWGLVSYVRRRK